MDSFDLLTLYAHKETTLDQLNHYTPPNESNQPNHSHYYIPNLSSFLRSQHISSLSSHYDNFPTSMLPIHALLTSEIRSHTFILDNVYGKQGIHTKTTDIWINAHDSWYTFDSMTSTIIPPNSCVFEIETHTYLSTKDSPLEFSISILLYGKTATDTPIHHPLVLSWEMTPLHNYSVSSTEVKEEYEQLKRALSTV